MSTFRVYHIVDGDTFDVSPNWQTRGRTGNRVRIANYDAPEKDGLGYLWAKQKLSNLLLNRRVYLSEKAIDQYGRLVADVVLA